ncbi:MAG: cytochrome C [Burkholderiales bacterium]|nr:cytochrome C [Burkholderiales bacterium]
MIVRILKLTAACALAIGTIAVAQQEVVKIDPDQMAVQGKPEFLASIGITEPAGPLDLTQEENLKRTQEAFNQKTEQHFASVHASKGIGCTDCHDQTNIPSTNWMARISNPPIKQTCQDCHVTQADVFAKTDTHSNLDCVGCHMPNIPAAENYSNEQSKAAKTALRRAHSYKIKVDPKATSMIPAHVKQGEEVGFVYNMAKYENGNSYVDLMWSCARNAPADYTVFEGRGCHSPYQSTLDEGLIYKDQREIYGEAYKLQKPVKDGYEQISEEIPRLRKLLEVTRLSPADQTDARLLLDKADDIATLIKKDGSWGMHAPNYLKDRVETAQAFLAKAQKIIDAGGYTKAAAK